MENLEALAEAVVKRLFVELEASGRHVHLSKADADALFGHPLTPDRPLSQPGQFLSRERVTILGPKGEFRKAAVLGPERKESQVELSLTDCVTLGVKAPIRLSGEIRDTPGITLMGPEGKLVLSHGVIVARRHIHLTPEAAARFSVRDGQVVKLETYTDRPLIFGDVVIRVSPDFAPYAHLDFDEANACGLRKGDLGRILP